MNSRPRPPVELDLSSGKQDYLSLKCDWVESTGRYLYTIDIFGPDGEHMHQVMSDKVKDKVSLAVLIATQLSRDPHFGFGQDQRPYYWMGNCWAPVAKWFSSLDYSMHVLARTALVSREGTLAAETMAAWRANSEFPEEGLNLTAFGTCPGIPLVDGILSFGALEAPPNRLTSIDAAGKSIPALDGGASPGTADTAADAEVEGDAPGSIPHHPRHMNLAVFPVYCEVARINMLLYAIGDDSLLRRFLQSTLSPAQLDVFQQWLGYHLVINKVPNPEKMVYLWGSGANGKSQLLWLIRGLVGKESCAELRLSDLKSSANVELLLGKVAMLGAEANTSTELERLKSLISREPQNVNPKYRDPYTIEPECLITQASNYPPTFDERSDALTRRVISLELKNSFKNGPDKVPDIAAKIIKDEFDVLFAFALLGAQKVLAEGRFEIPGTVEKESRAIVEKGNPFERFVDEQLEYGSYEISISELYKIYASWCRNGGGIASPASQQTLLEEISRISANKNKIVKKGRSNAYAASTWFDQSGKEVRIVPSLAARPEVVQGVRVNNRNGMIAGQNLPAKARMASLIESAG